MDAAHRLLVSGILVVPILFYSLIILFPFKPGMIIFGRAVEGYRVRLLLAWVARCVILTGMLILA